ncbi:MAG: hypothetical protein QWI36_04410 [Wolbachia endosymbiont of Tyrophagus putrescentiae]|nr:hypothetical protein [Wolbachia endosymbiont of Tyrophagus putrescentiae]
MALLPAVGVVAGAGLVKYDLASIDSLLSFSATVLIISIVAAGAAVMLTEEVERISDRTGEIPQPSSKQEETVVIYEGKDVNDQNAHYLL